MQKLDFKSNKMTITGPLLEDRDLIKQTNVAYINRPKYCPAVKSTTRCNT